MTEITILAGAVATMTGQGILRDQAVTVADGRIADVKPRESADLGGAVVDWRDRTLVPGLADCHAHLAERADMLLNLAHGVTLLRNMWGAPWHLQWQRDVAARREPGPFLVTTSPMADGRGTSGTTIWPTATCVDSREAAHTAVARWAELGYQQVKAYSWLKAPALQGLGEACREAGIPLVGDCPQALSIQEAMDLGQTCFEHLNNYEYGVLHPAARERLETLFPPGVSRLAPEAVEASADIDDAQLRDLAQRIADEDVTSCPTMIVWDRLLGERDMTDPRLRYVDPVRVEWWRPEKDFRFNVYSPEQIRRTGELWHDRTGRLLAALRDANARVLVGCDAPNAFVFHGSSVVEEMELLVEGGYSNAEVLEMATRGAADFLGLSDRGRIDVGCVADMLAVTGDPWASVSALRDPAAVVVGGAILDRPDLEQLLAEAEGLLHAEPEVHWEATEPDDQLVGEYDRTEFGSPAGRTSVSCCRPGEGRTRWTEQFVARGRSEERSTVVDQHRHVVSARVKRHRLGGMETATVERSADGASYRVDLTTLDGARLDAVIEGPLLPGADLGAPALLDALRMADAGDPLRVLTLDTRFANCLPPAPAQLTRSDEQLIQLTPDARIVVSGNEPLDWYSVAAPMEDVANHRVEQVGDAT